MNAGERLRLLRSRRANRYKRALGALLQLDAVRLDLEQLVKRRFEALGYIFHFCEAGVKELRRGGGRDNGFARDAHQDVPDGSHGHGS